MKRPKRKAIPQWVKSYVNTAQRGRCLECGDLLGPDKQFDHRPALILRKINEDGTDYIPPQNDPHFIEALHDRCHLERTTGRKRDAERTVTTKGSDIYLKAKFDRLEGRTKKRPTRKIPSRPFPKKRSTHVQG